MRCFRSRDTPSPWQRGSHDSRGRHHARAGLALAPTGRTLPYTREQVGAVIRDWARDNPPRRFAVYAYSEDDYGLDAELIAWGLDLEDHVLAQSLDNRTHLQFRSTAIMLTVLGARADVELVWVDDPGPMAPSHDERRRSRG